jgi:hypothetical protein
LGPHRAAAIDHNGGFTCPMLRQMTTKCNL